VAELPKRGIKGAAGAKWLNAQAAKFNCKGHKELNVEQLQIILQVNLEKDFPAPADPLATDRENVRRSIAMAGTDESAVLASAGLAGRTIEDLNHDELVAVAGALDA
jgi:hypothetical protein